MSKPIKIGNAQGFWGDSQSAPARLLEQQPDLDYLTLDYLAEVSLSILAMQQQRDPSMGYPKDFIDSLHLLAPHWKIGAHFKLITNAGGLNPVGCAKAALEVVPDKKIFIVTGDDVLEYLQEGDYPNLDTGKPIDPIRKSLVTANAYLGSQGIVKALERGADIVITGRTADPSLAAAASIYHFGWKWSDYDRIAGATIAGHLIECGTQVTGGISTHWLEMSDPAHFGFPIVEVASDGSCVVTKPEKTGGCVSEETVKEQLLYEIGDPDRYLSPDATVSFLSLALASEGENRVRVSGAKGMEPPDTYKVSATYRNGYMADAMLTLFGRDFERKAHLCGEVVRERVRDAGFELANYRCEPLGSVIRFAAADPRREALECFSREIAPLVTSGPQGITGYASGRPKVHQVFSFWPTLIPTSKVHPRIEEVKS